MKVLVISDTHGAYGNLRKAIDAVGDFDMLLHLGDVGNGYEDILSIAEVPMHMICGNNDFLARHAREKEILISGKKIFMTHGHRYYVNLGEERLIAEAEKRSVDAVIYGHTHRPSLHRTSTGMMVMNPGSLSFPRQADRAPSYMVMTIDESEDIRAQICYMR